MIDHDAIDELLAGYVLRSLTGEGFVALRRVISHSCRRAASGSIRDARLAGI